VESDVSYFRRRATEEKAAAQKAVHWQARQRHLEMAKRYDDLARAIDAHHQHFGLSLVDYPELGSSR
jgi:hypothetical protein